MFISEAFFYALIITGPIAALSLLRRRFSRGIVIGVGVSAVIALSLNFIFNWMILYWGRPPLNGPLHGYIWLLCPIFVALIIFLICDLIINLEPNGRYGELPVSMRDDSSWSPGWVVAAIAGAVMTAIFIWGYFIVPFGTGQSDALADLVTVEVQPPGSYPETDPNHMVLVPEETAIFKASQAIAKEEDEKGRNLGSLFQPGKPQLMAVNDHLYWISPLDFAGWRPWKQAGENGQTSPGYIVIDAEDSNAETQLKLGFKMRYTPSAWFANKLQRQLYDRGFAEYNYDDLTLEVDDDWRPWYTASLNKPQVRVRGRVPVAMITANPETGEIKEYELNKIPEWVDRVYSAGTVAKMVEYWGKWDQVGWRICCYSGVNQFKPASDPTLVYTEGGHPEWQIDITSMNKDTSIVGVMLFDPRSSTAKLYRILAGTPIENDILDIFLSARTNIKKLRPTHISLHRIYGEMTWVVSYITSAEQARQGPGEPFQGVGFLPASKPQGTNIVLADNKKEATTLYLQKLARIRAGSSVDVEEGSLTETIEGTVSQIADQDELGNTIYLIILEEEPGHVFRASFDVSEELPFIETGHRVLIRYINIGEATMTVGQIDDLDVEFEP